jgi:hypothetical protein
MTSIRYGDRPGDATSGTPCPERVAIDLDLLVVPAPTMPDLPLLSSARTRRLPTLGPSLAAGEVS